MFKVVLRSAEDTGCPTFKNKRKGVGGDISVTKYLLTKARGPETEALGPI